MLDINAIFQSDAPFPQKERIKVTLVLAWPAIVEQIMITMVQYIDTAMVGSLGSNATASIGIMTSTIWLYNGLLAAAGVGFSVQVAHFLGARKHNAARDVVRQSVLFNAIFGIILAASAVILSFFLPTWLGASPDIRPQASMYFRIIGISMPFLLTSNLFSSILRCAGDTKTPMKLNLLINILNVILNTIFIYPTRIIHLGDLSFRMFGLGLGVTGAAIGSALSALIVAILLLYVVYHKNSPIHIKVKEPYRFTKRCLSMSAQLGIPVALERATISIAQIVITMIISQIGTISIAANHLATTAEAICYLPAYGIAAAATTLVGQSIGANRDDLAISFSRITTNMGILFLTITGIGMFAFAPGLISIFTREPEVIALGTKVLRIEALAEPLFAASIVATGALRGAGDSKYPFLINLVSMWGVRITMAFIIAPKFGLLGVWIAMCVELCVRGTIFLFRLYSNKWLLNSPLRSKAPQKNI